MVDDPNVDGDQLIHVRCLPDRKILVDLNAGPNTIVMADGQGRATLNLSEVVSEDFQLSTEQVILTCAAASGDGVSHRHDPLAP